MTENKCVDLCKKVELNGPATTLNNYSEDRNCLESGDGQFPDVLLENASNFLPPGNIRPRPDFWTDPLHGDPIKWSVLDVCSWLLRLGFHEDIRREFMSQRVTGEVLLSLTEDDLKNELCIKLLGERRRLRISIEKLKYSYTKPSLMLSEVAHDSIERPCSNHISNTIKTNSTSYEQFSPQTISSHLVSSKSSPVIDDTMHGIFQSAPSSPQHLVRYKGECYQGVPSAPHGSQLRASKELQSQHSPRVCSSSQRQLSDTAESYLACSSHVTSPLRGQTRLCSGRQFSVAPNCNDASNRLFSSVNERNCRRGSDGQDFYGNEDLLFCRKSSKKSPIDTRLPCCSLSSSVCCTDETINSRNSEVKSPAQRHGQLSKSNRSQKTFCRLKRSSFSTSEDSDMLDPRPNNDGGREYSDFDDVLSSPRRSPLEWKSRRRSRKTSNSASATLPCYRNRDSISFYKSGRHRVRGEVFEPQTMNRQASASCRLSPEYFKTAISCFYMFLVTWITAIVMVFVHDRVPDRDRHPPLPDIFLDNVPHIPWAFQLCEVTIITLTSTLLIILVFHKHRCIITRRFAALSGTVFLLRCATMFITSLSVPGNHLQCAPREPRNFWRQVEQAWVIWQGGGLSIKGVRTCGDYMFSGHTSALTLLNFFITEYTPRRMYYVHIASWVLNMFGVFFILASHEHYSIDVFIAFYITSRMFLYYHSLANNRALYQRDSFRTKVWFPMFSFFESNVDCIVPNEFTNPFTSENFGYAFRIIITPPLWILDKLKIVLMALSGVTAWRELAAAKLASFAPSSTASYSQTSSDAGTRTSGSYVEGVVSENCSLHECTAQQGCEAGAKQDALDINGSMLYEGFTSKLELFSHDSVTPDNCNPSKPNFNYSTLDDVGFPTQHRSLGALPNNNGARMRASLKADSMTATTQRDHVTLCTMSAPGSPLPQFSLSSRKFKHN